MSNELCIKKNSQIKMLRLMTTTNSRTNSNAVKTKELEFIEESLQYRRLKKYTSEPIFIMNSTRDHRLAYTFVNKCFHHAKTEYSLFTKAHNALMKDCSWYEEAYENNLKIRKEMSVLDDHCGKISRGEIEHDDTSSPLFLSLSSLRIMRLFFKYELHVDVTRNCDNVSLQRLKILQSSKSPIQQHMFYLICKKYKLLNLQFSLLFLKQMLEKKVIKKAQYEILLSICGQHPKFSPMLKYLIIRKNNRRLPKLNTSFSKHGKTFYIGQNITALLQLRSSPIVKVVNILISPVMKSLFSSIFRKFKEQKKISVDGIIFSKHLKRKKEEVVYNDDDDADEAVVATDHNNAAVNADVCNTTKRRRIMKKPKFQSK
jgi:hypothetical protein